MEKREQEKQALVRSVIATLYAWAVAEIFAPDGSRVGEPAK